MLLVQVAFLLVFLLAMLFLLLAMLFLLLAMLFLLLASRKHKKIAKAASGPGTFNPSTG